MDNLFGQRLKQQHGLSDEQLKLALERQRLQGGRLGTNLAALGFITEEELDNILSYEPPIPTTVEQSGLTTNFVVDLALKHALFMEEFSAQELSDRVKLAPSIIEEAIVVMRREHYIDAKGAGGLSKLSVRYAISDMGKRRAQALLEISRYTGPAPVVLDDYRHMAEMQTVKNIMVGVDDIKRAFSHLVVSDQMLKRVGPAVSSGRAIFLYGPPGNGKTTIAETIAKVLPDTIFVPYALMVGDDLITLYDPVNHEAVPSDNDTGVDPRWLRIKRPVIMTGGELSLKMLDLEFNPISKFYEAPLQMKANNGMFIVDDFGRQQVDPQHLLNRWIVPLERRTDFLSLQNGMKFEIPFDQLVIFSTNIEPRKLVDEAFLRRIRYKILIDHPSEREYEEVFRRVCASNDIEFDQEVLDYLMENFYRRLGVKLNACHPRDLIDHIIDGARYFGHKPKLSKEAITNAWENYFVDI
ncbi:MAG: ATPase [Gammaproteobacteria bacterium]|nr:ATPase [Gammaproteobacteria bacterium]MCW8972213.1 ATPase [Gammaproteobacteria bacterium]MCW8993916.1 ATPase [Gammaproteobacteria bacterium]